ncbi:MAG TPA: hypothetical protein VGA62_04810, partial [Acidimicrobiia bacterium]
SDPPGISCPDVCTMSVAAGTQLALTASGARPGLGFARWSGACTGTPPFCTFAISGATRVGATFGPTPGWGVPRKVKSITDPQELYGPLKGFAYGPWLDAQQLSATVAATATNVKTGTRAYVLVVTCPQYSRIDFGNQPRSGTTGTRPAPVVARPCVGASDTPIPGRLAGQRVYTYLLGKGTGVARLLADNPSGYEVIVLSSESRDALDIMTQLIRIDR